LDKKEENGFISSIAKKDASGLRRERKQLRKSLSGLPEMSELPDIVIIANGKTDNTALLECNKLKIPVIAVVNSDCDPSLADIPIPADNRNPDVIRLIFSGFVDNLLTLQREGSSLKSL
jgi:small subunit ribosomal protein S2